MVVPFPSISNTDTISPTWYLCLNTVVPCPNIKSPHPYDITHTISPTCYLYLSQHGGALPHYQSHTHMISPIRYHQLDITHTISPVWYHPYDITHMLSLSVSTRWCPALTPTSCVSSRALSSRALSSRVSSRASCDHRPLTILPLSAQSRELTEQPAATLWLLLNPEHRDQIWLMRKQ